MLFLLQGRKTIAELVEGARDVAILSIAIEVEALGTLSLKQRELDVVGEEEQVIGVGHDDKR